MLLQSKLEVMQYLPTYNQWE